MPRAEALHVRRLPRLRALPRPRLALEALLDRFVRGRAWIPLLAVALVGIVTMQVEVLKLGSSVGRSMNTATELTSQIQIDRAQVSELASPTRIERLAASYGLVEPGPTDPHFVSAHTNVNRAVAGIHPVDAASFAANLARERAVDDVTPTAAAPVTATATVTPAATDTPTADPTVTPTADPTVTPTADPTVTPTADPTVTPTAAPAVTPAVAAPVTASPTLPATGGATVSPESSSPAN